MQEQRLDIRWAMQWPAVFITKACGRQPCRILDFCGGGALVGLNAVNASDIQRLTRGDFIVLQLRSPKELGGDVYELRGKVAHLGDAVIGVAFVKPNAASLKALASIADINDFEVPLDSAAREIAISLQTELTQFSAEKFANLLGVARARFQFLSEKTSSPEKELWATTSAQLEARFKERLMPAFSHSLRVSANRLILGGSASLNHQDKNVVASEDEDAFATWLLIKVMAGRVEYELAPLLDVIAMRLMSASIGLERRHACHPKNICEAFRHALTHANFPERIEAELCKLFEKEVLANLRALYERIDQMLEAKGMRAELSDLSMPASVKPVANAGLTINALDADISKRPRSVEALLHGWSKAQADTIHVNKFSIELRNLWLSSKGVDVAHPHHYTTDQKQSVQQHKQAKAAASYFVNTWFSLIKQERKLTELAAVRLGLLEGPIAELLTIDDHFLESKDHPIQLLINGLIARGIDSEHHILIELITTVKSLPAAAQSYASVWPEFDKVFTKFELAKRLQADRLQRQLATEWRLSKAKRHVDEGIAIRLEGAEVPKAFMVLLESGWRQYVEHCDVRFGSTADQTLQAWQVLDEILALGIDSNHPINMDEIIKRVSNGLEQIRIAQADIQLLENQLKHLLRVVSIQRGSYTENRIVMCSSKPANLNSTPAKNHSSALIKWLQRVESLHIGDALHLAFKGGDTEHLSLVWKSDDNEQFIFSENELTQPHRFSKAELAALLRHGQAYIVDGCNKGVAAVALEKTFLQLYRELIHQASHDALTGLMTRQAFVRRLDDVIESAKRNQTKHVVAEIRIDQFDDLNKTLNTELLDQVLLAFTDLLKQPLKGSVLLAKFRHGAFAILIESCELGVGLQLLSRRLAELAVSPLRIGDKQFALTASAGIADISFASENSSQILDAIKDACVRSMHQGGGRINVYRPSDEEIKRRDSVIANMLRLNSALENNRLQLRCQRIEPLKSQSINAPALYEILLGIPDIEADVFTPASFVQAAERYGRMKAIDRWVIDNAFEWLAKVPSRSKRVAGIAINLSRDSLNDEALIDFVTEKVAQWRISPNMVCFEITEATAISNLASATHIIRELRRLGFKFSLADFGVEQLSYEDLKRLPVDFIKIDGAYIREMSTNGKADLIVKAINEMAHTMHLKTVASFVESAQVAEQLKTLGVDFAQGYGIERPRWLSSLSV